MVIRGGYGVFYNLFDRIGSEDQIALNPRHGLVSLQPSTQLGHGAALPPAERVPPGYLDPSRIDLPARSSAARTADSPKTTIQQASIGAQRDLRARSWVVSAGRHRDQGHEPGQPDQPEPAAAQRRRQQRARPAALSQRSGLIEWREAERRFALQGHGLRVREALLERLRFRPRLHPGRMPGQHRRAPDHRGLPSRSQNARDLEAWYGPSDYDNRHRFAVNFVARAAVRRESRARARGKAHPRRLDAVGIFAARSGRPFTVIQGNNNVGP